MFYSYDFQNLVRDVDPIFQAIRQAAPVFLSLVPVDGMQVLNTKHEWTEDKLSPKQGTINNGGGYNDAATDLVVDSVAGFEVGQVLTVDGSDEAMLLTDINSGTKTLTVTRSYGGSTAEAIADDALIRIIAKPRLQGTDPGDDGGQQPTIDYNYTQILDKTANVTRTGQQVRQYGVENALNYEVNVQMDQLVRELNLSAIYGKRVAPAANVPSMMGGILQFLNQAGGNSTNAAGNELDDIYLNDSIESIVTDGGAPRILLCNTNQARRITGLNRTANNYTVVQDAQNAGNVVYRFVNDLPMGIITDIVVDVNFPRDAVALLDPSRLALCAMKKFSDEDARVPGGDYFARRILGEYTLMMRNAKEAHGLIKNLAV